MKKMSAAAAVGLFLYMAAPASALDFGLSGRNAREDGAHLGLGSGLATEPFSFNLFVDNSEATDWQTYQSAMTQAASEADLTYRIEDLLLLGRYRFDNYQNVSGMQPIAEQQNHRLTAYGKTRVGQVDLEAEWGWQFADRKEFSREEANFRNAGIDAKACKITGSTQLDRFNIGLTYLWATVQDEAAATGNDLTAAMAPASGSLWNDSTPYYLLNAASVGNDSFYPKLAMRSINSFGVHADYQVSGQLILHSALAYDWADNTAKAAQGAVSKANTAAYSGDDEYGWEVDLGAKYKLFDNLTYEVRATYFNSGDFFEDLNQPAEAPNKANNLYLFSHHLTMTF